MKHFTPNEGNLLVTPSEQILNMVRQIAYAYTEAGKQKNCRLSFN